MPAKPARYTCPHCGCEQETPARPPVGTRVKHPKRGEGVISSYDHCDAITCDVDYNGQEWTERLRELTILP